jgi:pimeloyl-ACP methyl ester carboxylesterase
MEQSGNDPLACRLEVPVPGGTLHVACAGTPAAAADRVALAVHGVTGSLMAWRTIARELDERICLLAPDLRGRGHSRRLPGPYGLGAHVADLIAVLDHVGAPSAVLVGHSMGAFLALRIAAEYPERALGVVLLDAGLPFSVPDDTEPFDAQIANVAARLAITFPSAHHYLQAWQAHPALKKAWNGDPQAAEDFEAYARYDMVEDGRAVRCTAVAAAVRTDSKEMVTADDVTRTALDRVRAPVHLLRAERGLADLDPLIPADTLQAFRADYPSVRIEEVADVNHYTLLLGPRRGPQRVAAAIEAFCGAVGCGRNGGKRPDRRRGQ